MSDEEKRTKLIEYSERYRFWSDHFLNQFGFTTNLFITIDIGFLGYLISIRDKYPNIVFDRTMSADWRLIFYLATVILIIFSTLVGFTSIISRLYDLRLTKHIILARKSVFEKLNRYLPDDFIDLKDESLLNTFFRVLFCKIEFIGIINDSNYQEVRLKFNNLRKQSKILGCLSWKTHKMQILSLFISALVYSLTILK